MSGAGKARVRAVTLIELLVVIGVIGLLLAILLPAMSAVRRRAQTVACSAALREIGNAFTLYALEHKGYWPVSTLLPRAGLTYSIDGDTFTSNRPATWQNFIAKYVTREKLGILASSPQELAAARRAVTWGCPTWMAAGDTNGVRCGYGLNLYPTFTSTVPPAGRERPPLPHASLSEWPPAVLNDHPYGWKPAGAFFKASQYTRPAERALLADCDDWQLHSRAPPMDGSFPPQLVLTETLWTFNLPGQTVVAVYRHGQYPPVLPPPEGMYGPLYQAGAGKVAYNILYCDGHVAAHHDQREAYRSIRMRYPG